MNKPKAQQIDTNQRPKGLAGTEMVAISALKLNPRNARTHPKRKIKKLARSLDHFGMPCPVLIDRKMRIAAGNARVAAAKLLGWQEVPVLRIEHLSEADLIAYIKVDNRLAEEAAWNKEMLAIELQVLIDLDYSIELTGFDQAEVDDILENQAKAEIDNAEDELPPAPESGLAVTQLNDLWLLGGHRLFCGDATDAASYQSLLKGSVASLIFTDPPYNVPIGGHVSGLGKAQHREFAMASGEKTPEEFTGFLQKSMELMAANSAPGSIHYICMDWRHMAEIIAAGESVYTELKNLCVWVKNNGGMGTFYRSRHELIFVFKNGTAPHINNFELGQTGRYRTNVWEYRGVNSFGAERDEALAMHPTVKPVELVADAIRDCSKRNQIVLDPFGGSGTTLIAAEKTGRRGYLIELDPLYCDTIIRRWQAFTGLSALHDGSRGSFDEMEEFTSAEAAEAEAIPPTSDGKIPQGKFLKTGNRHE